MNTYINSQTREKRSLRSEEEREVESTNNTSEAKQHRTTVRAYTCVSACSWVQAGLPLCASAYEDGRVCVCVCVAGEGVFVQPSMPRKYGNKGSQKELNTGEPRKEKASETEASKRGGEVRRGVKGNRTQRRWHKRRIYTNREKETHARTSRTLRQLHTHGPCTHSSNSNTPMRPEKTDGRQRRTRRGRGGVVK